MNQIIHSPGAQEEGGPISLPPVPPLILSHDPRLSTLSGRIQYLQNPPMLGEISNPRGSLFPLMHECSKELCKRLESIDEASSDHPILIEQARGLTLAMKRAASDYPWLTDSAPLNPDTAVDVSSYYSIGAALVIEIRNFAEKLGSLGVSSSIEGLSNAGAFIQRTEERLRPVKGEGTKAWMEHCWAHYTGN